MFNCVCVSEHFGCTMFLFFFSIFLTNHFRNVSHPIYVFHSLFLFHRLSLIYLIHFALYWHRKHISCAIRLITHFRTHVHRTWCIENSISTNLRCLKWKEDKNTKQRNALLCEGFRLKSTTHLSAFNIVHAFVFVHCKFSSNWNSKFDMHKNRF